MLGITGDVFLGVGRLAEARAQFWRDAEVAEANGDSDGLAVAALGLGGIWVHEHRTTLEQAWVEPLQRHVRWPGSIPTARSPTGCASGWPPRRPTLPGDPAPVLAELGTCAARPAIRSSWPRRCRLPTIACSDHTTPRCGWPGRRADRCVAGDRTVVGRPDGPCLANDRSRSSPATGAPPARSPSCASGSAGDAVRRAGRTSSRRSTSCWRCATEPRRRRGARRARATRSGWTSATPTPSGGTAPSSSPSAGCRVAPCEVLPLVARPGQLHHGRRAGHRRSSPPWPPWPPTVGDRSTARAALASLRAVGLGDAAVDRAAGRRRCWACAKPPTPSVTSRPPAEAYELLAPFADLPVMASLGVACFGSAHRPLGLAALDDGRPRRGGGPPRGRRGRRARHRDRPWHAISLATLADVLDQPRQPATPNGPASCARGDRRRPSARHGRAGRSVGARSVQTIRGLPPRRADVAIRLGEHTAVVPHSVGMDYLARLDRPPGLEIAAVELASGHALAPGHARRAAARCRATAEYRRPDRGAATARSTTPRPVPTSSVRAGPRRARPSRRGAGADHRVGRRIPYIRRRRRTGTGVGSQGDQAGPGG